MPPPIERAERQFGKYRLLAHIASGGMAEIYIASHEQLAGFQKIVVVKRLQPHLQKRPDFVAMFLEEARTAARLNHPNTVQIFELGRIEESYFIAMEYLAGESLATVISAHAKARKRFRPELAAGIVMQAAEGLHHAHTLRGSDGRPLSLVHRDISPPNIFVLYDGAVKVVDFGVAKHAERESQTRVGVLKGKIGYMSPEQLAHDEIDARSDIFSLGVVLWECLTCRKLYRGTEYQAMRAIAETDAPSPRKVHHRIPVELERISLKALARDRDQRYQSAAELRADLATFLRASAAEADTVAIGQLMMTFFRERAEKKQALFLRARDSLSDATELIEGIWEQAEQTSTPSVPQKTPEPSGPNRPPLGTPPSGMEPPADDEIGFDQLEPTVRMTPSFTSQPEQPAAELAGVAPLGSSPLARTEDEPPLAEPPLAEPSRPRRRAYPAIAVASAALLLAALVLIVTSRSDEEGVSPGPDGALVAVASHDAAEVVDDTVRAAQPDAAPAGGEEPDSGSSDLGPEPRPQAPAAALADSSAEQQRKPSRRVLRQRKPRRAAGAPSPSKDQASPPPPAPPQAEPAEEVGRGMLRLQTTPWSIVYYKGRKLGESPLIDVELPAGKLTLRAVNAEESIDAKITVEIKPGQRTDKNVYLR